MSFVLLVLFAACAKSTVPLPRYEEFVSTQKQVVPTSIVEVYGRYAATASDRKISSSFNLLLEPGKNAYLEILNPAKQLVYAFSLNTTEAVLLWAQDNTYIKEEANPQTLNAIAGLPLMPDDVLLLVAGYGLNFDQWQILRSKKDGWILKRPPFIAELSMKEHLSRLEIASNFSPPLNAQYEQYRDVDNRSLPAKIGFEVPARKISLRLEIAKYLPRAEPATAGLFEVKLPAEARRVPLNQIYRGKPLILQ